MEFTCYLRLRDLMSSPEATERVHQLRQGCRVTLENPKFDPWESGVQLMVSCQNPLAFTNWRADIETMIRVCWHAIFRSAQGRRICDTDRLVDTYQTFTLRDEVLEDELKSESKWVRQARLEWEVVQNDSDCVEFIELIVQLAWLLATKGNEWHHASYRTTRGDENEAESDHEDEAEGQSENEVEVGNSVAHEEPNEVAESGGADGR